MAVRVRKIRILLTGGGTGGHIYPLTAVAKELFQIVRARGYEPDIRYYGDPGPFRLALESVGVEIRHITSSKWRRYFDLENILDLFKFVWSVKQSLWKILWFMPDVVFSKGGPGSFTIIVACRFYGIPIVIHESDAVLGLANRAAAQYARFVELAFASAKNHLPAGKPFHVVGNPVRTEILAAGGSGIGDNRAAKIEFGFESQTPLVLFLGGSQGAEKLNDFVLENIDALTSRFQILHQTGEKNFEAHRQQFEFLYRGRTESLVARYKFFPFFDRNLPAAYQAADLVVARAGAGLIFEIAAMGKPSILVPITKSANDHQRENAYAYAKTGATIVIEEENFLPSLFINEAEKILKDSIRIQAMIEATKKFSVPDSTKLIAEDILGILKL